MFDNGVVRPHNFREYGPWIVILGSLLRVHATSRVRAVALHRSTAPARLSRRARVALGVVAMRMGIDATRLLAECGQAPFANRRRYMQEVRYRFHNVHGMRSDGAARGAYLRAARDVCDVLVLAETNCPGDEDTERIWGREWPEGYTPVWASDKGARLARGMAVMVSKRLPQAAPHVACADPEGRYLAVWLTVFGRRTLLVGVHADNDTDADQAAFYQRVERALPSVGSDTDVIWMGDMNNVEVRALDYTRVSGVRDNNRPRGVAAMQSVGRALGGVRDAFRALHPSAREYTRRAALVGGDSSRARLDRAYVSAHMVGARAPCVVESGHVTPSAESLAVLGVGDPSLRSDHAAVSVVVRYSEDARAPGQWHIPRHLLSTQSMDTVLHMRKLMEEGMGRGELTPIQRVLYILEVTRAYCKQTVRERTRKRSAERARLHGALRRCEALIGEGVGEPRIGPGADRDAIAKERDEIEERLQRMRQADHTRWLADRAYDEYTQSDRCSKAFFEGSQADRVDSTVREVRSGTRRAKGTHAILRETRRFFGGAGGFFNNGVRVQRASETRLLDALAADGRVQPAERRDDLSLENVCSPLAVQRAIDGLPGYAMPALDGFTTDYFKVMTAVREREDGGEEEGVRPPHPFAELLGEAFKEVVQRPEGLPPEMASVVVSLIYKEKGYRYDLSRYRPIAVMSVLYKIMTRCMADALQPSLPYLIAPEQNAFQRSKYIFDDNRTVQDAVAYLEQQGRGGVLLFCDQKSAYPRVKWAFLQRVMARMGLHSDFRLMVRSLYDQARVHVKVNGVVSDGFSPRHGLHQGCPCSPVLYLLCLQTFMSLMATDDGGGDPTRRLRGIQLPQRDGTERETHALGYADDLVGLLADEQQLVRFKELLTVYELGSGAENDWAEKTAALRVGTLRDSTAMPAWDGPTEAQLFGREAVVRYLGVFLGAPEAVAREWDKRTTAKIGARYAQWAMRGGARTVFGRNIVVRNSVMAVAWYLVTNQCPPHLDDMLVKWERATWAFVEQPSGAWVLTDRQRKHGAAHHVSRPVMVQDYPEGGARCLDVERFTRAVCMRHIRRLLDPVEQGWKGMAMHWLETRYGALKQGYRLLMSACDFLAVLEAGPVVPDFWQNAFVTWGMYDAPVPHTPGADVPSGAQLAETVRAERAACVSFDAVWTEGRSRTALPQRGWTLARVAMEPLAYNQHISGVWGARVLEPTVSADVLTRTHECGSATLTRVSTARRRQAAMVLRRYLAVAAAGYTHMMHLLVVDRALGRVRMRRYAELSRRGMPPCMPEQLYAKLVAGLPAAWLEVLDTASAMLTQRMQRGEACALEDLIHAYPLEQGTWVSLPSGHVTRVGSSGVGEGSMWAVTPTGRLRLEEADMPMVARDRLMEVDVWTTQWRAHSEADEEQQERRHARGQRAKGKTPEQVYGGTVAQRTLLEGLRERVMGPAYAGAWALTYGVTDRMRPAVPFVACDVSHLYWMQLSRAHVMPRPLAEGHDSDTSTSWVDLLDHPDQPPRAVRLAAFQALVDPHLPRWTRECHWRVLLDAWPIGNGRCQREGADSQLCMICYGMGRGCGLDRAAQLRTFRETTRHVRLDCPYAMAVVDTVARAVSMAAGQPASARRPAAGAFLREVGAAMVTGHREGGTPAKGPLAVVVAELSRVLIERQQRNAAGGLLDCDAGEAYRRVRTAVDDALRQSWREANARERAMLMWVKELPEHDTPTEEWKKVWAGYFTEGAAGSMELSFPRTRAEVAGAEDAMPVAGVKVLARVRANGTRAVLQLRAATVFGDIMVGGLSAPVCVLTGPAVERPSAPRPPRELLRPAGGRALCVC